MELDRYSQHQILMYLHCIWYSVTLGWARSVMVKLVVSWVRTRFITFGVIATAECVSRFRSTCVYLVFSTCNMKARIPIVAYRKTSWDLLYFSLMTQTLILTTSTHLDKKDASSFEIHTFICSAICQKYCLIPIDYISLDVFEYTDLLLFLLT